MPQGPRLVPRTRLMHPRARERCAREISGLRAGRGDGVCVAASSKLLNVCRWKRGEPRRFCSACRHTPKRGAQKTDPEIAPLQSSTPGVGPEVDPLFLRLVRIFFCAPASRLPLPHVPRMSRRHCDASPRDSLSASVSSCLPAIHSLPLFVSCSMATRQKQQHIAQPHARRHMRAPHRLSLIHI